MAKIIRKKRKLRIQALISLFFFFSFIFYLCAMTGLKSYNVTLAKKVETKQEHLADVQEKVTTLEAIIKELSNYEAIAKIAEKDGMRAIQSNVKLLNGE
ncbi:MAG: hypothetical protein HFF01_04440 [Erysipelotrichaceae bacterium]|nr:hypothetical protein [Erysipelotrichaceae bacterium]MCI9524284.1 hypothetical protein [Erysipelotrichaceae bacterium]